MLDADGMPEADATRQMVREDPFRKRVHWLVCLVLWAQNTNWISGMGWWVS